MCGKAHLTQASCHYREQIPLPEAPISAAGGAFSRSHYVNLESIKKKGRRKILQKEADLGNLALCF